MRRLGTLAVVLTLVATAAATVSPEIDRALRDGKYVYVQSERKSGKLGKPAEIWFYYDGKAVYVGTPPSSWRVKRIKAGHKKARIVVGKADGPAFDATGEVVRDGAVEQRLMDEYARKYPEGWARFADKFRDGFKTGERVLVRYTPK
ncbi:MAG TPA: hypothetical protein VEM57_09085 [Candidatus Binatus sp.]|nr:hypothetical protein [Candidatus Binatus sp.]